MHTREQIRAHLGTKTIAIIGCGGLGSNAAAMLARAGIGKLVLADFDRVDESNLDRQLYFADQVGALKTEALAENLKRVRRDIQLVLANGVVTAETLPGIVRGADVIIEAVDTAEGKAMIAEVWSREMPEIPLVTASGIAGVGSANDIVTERLAENLYVVGDLTSDASAGLPLIASRVVVAAAAQAHMAIRLLLGFTEA